MSSIGTQSVEGDFLDVLDDCIGDLQRYVEDDTNVCPENKSHYITTLCFAYIPDFDTDVLPYSHKIFDRNKRQHKPSLSFLKQEMKRRNPTLKGYKNKPSKYILDLLSSAAYKLPELDMQYLQMKMVEYKNACEAKIAETTSDIVSVSSQATPRITTEDRLRLIEAFLSDEAKPKMASTQECYTRQELDARNSEVAADDYFQTVSDVFNNEAWVPRLQTYPDLHPDLAEPCDLPLKQYRTTRAKVKDKYDEMRIHLHGMVIKWEQSGNGGQQRAEDAEDFGSFDPLEVDDGDNRRNFLPNGNDSMYYLLYFWERLDGECQLQFTLAKLPDSAKATSDQFSLTSPHATMKKDKMTEFQSKQLQQFTEERKERAEEWKERKEMWQQQSSLMKEQNALMAQKLKTHNSEVTSKSNQIVGQWLEKILDLDMKLIDVSEDSPMYEKILSTKRKYEQLIEKEEKLQEGLK
jgi:hypothetical protein